MSDHSGSGAMIGVAAAAIWLIAIATFFFGEVPSGKSQANADAAKIGASKAD